MVINRCTKNSTELSKLWSTKINGTSYKRAKEHLKKKNGAGNSTPKPVPPNLISQVLSVEDKEKIKNFYKLPHISKQSTKQTKIKNTTVTTHYLIVTITKAFQLFKVEFKNNERLEILNRFFGNRVVSS